MPEDNEGLTERVATERLLDMVDELYRKYGVELDAEDTAIAQAARNASLQGELQELSEDDEMVSAVEAWLAANPAPRLPASVRAVLTDCAEFLSDIDGDLAHRCEAALRTAAPQDYCGIKQGNEEEGEK
jgi:hypothetical protein